MPIWSNTDGRAFSSMDLEFCMNGKKMHTETNPRMHCAREEARNTDGRRGSGSDVSSATKEKNSTHRKPIKKRQVVSNTWRLITTVSIYYMRNKLLTSPKLLIWSGKLIFRRVQLWSRATMLVLVVVKSVTIKNTVVIVMSTLIDPNVYSTRFLVVQSKGVRFPQKRWNLTLRLHNRRVPAIKISMTAKKSKWLFSRRISSNTDSLDVFADFSSADSYCYTLIIMRIWV